MPAPRKPDQASPKLTSPTGVTNGQTTLIPGPSPVPLGLHRVWDRAPKVMASAVPPSG